MANGPGQWAVRGDERGVSREMSFLLRVECAVNIQRILSSRFPANTVLSAVKIL